MLSHLNVMFVEIIEEDLLRFVMMETVLMELVVLQTVFQLFLLGYVVKAAIYQLISVSLDMVTEF